MPLDRKYNPMLQMGTNSHAHVQIRYLTESIIIYIYIIFLYLCATIMPIIYNSIYKRATTFDSLIFKLYNI